MPVGSSQSPQSSAEEEPGNGDNLTEDFHMLIGESYVHEMMDGEALSEELFSRRQFILL
jgi:hypothetical protein